MPQPTDSSTLAQVTSFLDQTVSLVQEETDKLKALKTPSADKATLAGIIDAQANQIPQVQDASSKFKAGDTAGGNQEMQTISTDSTSVDQKFDSYGLTSCGSKSA